MCRHCARSCKINSYIFKSHANESVWWTGLLAWNLITSAVPFANESTFSLCLSLSFFILLSFTLHVPCNPLCGTMSWIQNPWCDSLRRRKKKMLPLQTPNSYFIQQSRCCLQKEKDTERSTYRGFSCLFYLILLLLLLIFSRTSKWRFLFLCSVTHLGPETGRTACQLLLHHLHWFSCLELAGVSPGLVFQKPLYHVPAHYHVLSRTNAGNLTPQTRSRTLQSPPSSLLFSSSPHSSLTNSHIFVLLVLQHLRAFCSSKVTDALPDPPTTTTTTLYLILTGLYHCWCWEKLSPLKAELSMVLI